MKAQIEGILRLEPGLKAREIAKKLSVDRGDVNPILYKNTEIFRVDSQYCWTLIDQNEMVIEFGGECWVDAPTFEASLSQAGSPLDAEARQITFCVPKGCKILLEASARLLALSNQLIQAGKGVTIDFSNCVNTLTYFNRMGFFDSLNQSVNVIPNRPTSSLAKRYQGNNSSVVEFGIVQPASSDCPDDLTEEDYELINRLTDSFVSNTDDRYEGVVTSIFSELIGNIKGHSETSIAGFAAFQGYTGNAPHIQTVVSDSGLGIATTLKRSLSVNYPDINRRIASRPDFDAALVIEALTKGQISRHGRGRGLGFGNTSRKALNFNVKLSARQETFSVQVAYLNGELVDVLVCNDLVTIRGTHICFDFRVD